MSIPNGRLHDGPAPRQWARTRLHRFLLYIFPLSTALEPVNYDNDPRKPQPGDPEMHELRRRVFHQNRSNRRGCAAQYKRATPPGFWTLLCCLDLGWPSHVVTRMRALCLRRLGKVEGKPPNGDKTTTLSLFGLLHSRRLCYASRLPSTKAPRRPLEGGLDVELVMNHTEGTCSKYRCFGSHWARSAPKDQCNEGPALWTRART